MIRTILQQKLTSIVKRLSFPSVNILIETPPDFSFGDYSTSIAMKIHSVLLQKKSVKLKSPRQIAERIVFLLQSDTYLKRYFSSITIAGPGFINFYLHPDWLSSYISKCNTGNYEISPYHFGENKKIMIEFAHPNTLKPFHIGHLRNISIGEALCRIYEYLGNTVIRANYEGDVGLHIAKTIYGLTKGAIKTFNINALDSLSLDKKIDLLGKAYVEGNNAYVDSKESREKIKEINRRIYEKDSSIMPIWKKTRSWSLLYFDRIYHRVYTRFNRLFFESEVIDKALSLAKKLHKKGILEKSDGALIFRGEKYGLETRVFVTKENYPTYEGKDLALAEIQSRLFGKIDKIIHVVDTQQSRYFQTIFKVLELFDKDRYKEVEVHYSYGFVRLSSGKMSSRKGNVILGEWLIDETRRKLRSKFPTMDDDTLEKVAVASVKYAFLRIDSSQDMEFDINTSISLEGNSGPYLLYTYARICSLFDKAREKKIVINKDAASKLTNEELPLARILSRYSIAVYDAGKQMAPHIISRYLYELAREFNLFYQKSPVLTSHKHMLYTRLLLANAVRNVIHHGLNLLGIKTVEKM